MSSNNNIGEEQVLRTGVKWLGWLLGVAINHDGEKGEKMTNLFYSCIVVFAGDTHNTTTSSNCYILKK